jgi:hypothetical protein
MKPFALRQLLAATASAEDSLRYENTLAHRATSIAFQALPNPQPG